MKSKRLTHVQTYLDEDRFTRAASEYDQQSCDKLVTRDASEFILMLTCMGSTALYRLMALPTIAQLCQTFVDR
jgi:hypothetical protein